MKKRARALYKEWETQGFRLLLYFLSLVDLSELKSHNRLGCMMRLIMCHDVLSESGQWSR